MDEPCSCAMCRTTKQYDESPGMDRVVQNLGEALALAVDAMKSRTEPDWEPQRTPEQVLEDACLYTLLAKRLYDHTLDVLSLASTFADPAREEDSHE